MGKKSKVAIIGCSIAGSALALLLGKKGIDVKVFEQKSKTDTGNKVCGNVVTSSFLKLSCKMGINPNKVITKNFSVAEFTSQANSVKLAVKDYEIDRKKLLEDIVRKAEDKGVEFFFNAKFKGFEKNLTGYDIFVGNEVISGIDYIIGADGALSEVAKRAGLWQNRNFWLAVQTKIPKKRFRKIKIDSEKYRVFFIPKFGHYSYVFASRKYIVAGTVASPETAKERFKEFAAFLGVGKCRIESALIPLPRKIKWRRGNIFLSGDAACQTKFSGGGIIPAIESAFALAELIVDGKTNRFNELKREILFHQLITRVLGRMDADDFDELFDIAKKNKIALKSRDELRKWALGLALRNPRLIRLLPKLI